MSEHIAHIAIYEDTSHIIRHSGHFGEAFKQSLRQHPDAGLLSSGARGNHLFAIPLVEKVRDNWEKGFKTERYGEMLAAAIGWLSHRAIDLQVKPNYIKQKDIKNPRFSNYEQQIYCDALVFDKVYGGGIHPSASPMVELSKATLEYHMASHPGAELVHVPHLEPLVVAMVQQQLLAMRRFNQEATTPEDWFRAYEDEYQKTSENLEVYIEAFSNPDPLKTKKYLEEPNFYNQEDDIIRLARDLQHRGTSSIDVEQAVEKGKEQSHYAQGLSRSYRFNKSAQGFFNKKISKDQVYDQVEIFHEAHRI